MNMNQENDNELKKSAPYLASLEKKNSFQAPEGFFEDLPSKIEDKIQAATTEKKHTYLSLHYVKYAVAAVVLLVAGYYFYPSKTVPQKNAFTAWNVDSLTDDELLDEWGDFPIEYETETVVSNDDADMINYLIDNKVDVTEINGI